MCLFIRINRNRGLWFNSFALPSALERVNFVDVSAMLVLPNDDLRANGTNSAESSSFSSNPSSLAIEAIAKIEGTICIGFESLLILP